MSETTNQHLWWVIDSATTENLWRHTLSRQATTAATDTTPD